MEQFSARARTATTHTGLKKTKYFALVAATVLVAATWVTAPQSLTPDELPDHQPDAMAGELVFWAGGCASCHATPVDGRRAKGNNKLLLGGGLELDTPFGVFRAPNISPAPEGIGGWNMLDFVNAMKQGVSPDGRHYYPSFPYASYTRMTTADVMDLKAFLDTLPAITQADEEHTLAFPYSVRRGVGIWKRLYVDEAPVVETEDEVVERGRYLVEGAGHCGECHTPRDGMGGPLNERWLAGAPNLDGEGRIPNITPAGKNVSGWSHRGLFGYLKNGFTPDFDTAGGTMVAVQENLAKLPDSDLDAIAAYLKAIPPVEKEE